MVWGFNPPIFIKINLSSKNMNAKTLTSVEIPENVIVSLGMLSPDRLQQVFDFVEFLSQKQRISDLREQAIAVGNAQPERVLGLHSDKGWVSDDFDEPLPDEFWTTETT
jgi:hypothetical protein